jgi:hypothetical protein
MPGVKGKRVAGRPGRFDPTIPLHMTTRRKAAKTAPDMDMYGDDEYDEADSRRTSLDEISVTTPYSEFDSEPPAKRQRTADPSPQQSIASPLDPQEFSMGIEKASSALFDVRDSVASGSVTSLGGVFTPPIDIDVSHDSIDAQTGDNSIHGGNHAVSTDLHMTEGGSERHDPDLRLDETHADDSMQYDNANGADIEDKETELLIAGGPESTHGQVTAAYQSGDDGDWAEAVNPLPSMRESEARDASVESSRSDRPAVRDIPLPEVSTDATPMATRQGSPATTASAAAEDLTPARSKPADTLELTGSDDDEDEEEEGDDMEPATEIQDTMENMEEEEAEVPRYVEEYEEDDAPARKTTKRRFAGGRRRAAHANAYVEAALRRQLELKQIYRQVTRAMKSCLGELAQITLDELETDQQQHTQASEYDTVIAELDAQLARRKKQLLNAQKFNHEQLLQRYDAESDSRRNRCRNLLEDIKEQQLVNLEYNMLQVNRAKLRDEVKPGHETEDEDGVIPRPKRMAYRFKRSNAIDLRYDSRSRFTMETERRVDDLQRRTNMWEALRAYDPEAVEAFTVMDSAAREAAEERRRNVDITSKLADIAAEYDRLYNAPVPPQAPPPLTAEELAPLNALAELAVAPGLRSQRPKGRHLPSSTIGPFQHLPNQSRSPFPSPSSFGGSAGATQNHPHQNPFLRLAMEQSRVPSHPFGQPPLSSILPSSMRKPDDASNKASPAMSRSMDSKPPLAAKPALQQEQTGRERSESTNIRPTPPVDRTLNEMMADQRQTLHVDRAMLLAQETARRISETPDKSSRHSRNPSSTGYHENNADHVARTEAVGCSAQLARGHITNINIQERHSYSVPPHLAEARSATSGDREIKSEQGSDFWRRRPSISSTNQHWQGPITNVADREGYSRRRGSGLRGRSSKRHRESDFHDEMRNQRPRASTTSLARQRSRSKSAERAPKDEEELRARLRSMSPRSRRIAGLRDDEPIRRISDQDRRLSTQSHRGGRRPSDASVGQHPARRSSDMRPPPVFQQGPARPPPPFPVPPFMPQSTWSNGPFFPQQPMSAPTAQPINHFANAQGGLAGSAWAQPPYQPGANPPPPPPPFRDMFGRR